MIELITIQPESMDIENKIEQLIKQRHLYLWNRITQIYKIPKDMNSTVHKLIASGKVSDHCETLKPLKK